ncbi:MAG: hypothetical protein U5O39_04900 [Gammaproteobacteria bacterium]|nr:hypothetical protein [Gammaproteobacteria bacterium]
MSIQCWRNAALVAGAEMDLEQGRYRRALEALGSANDNDRVTRMKSEAMLALRDWQGLFELMPALKKIMKDSDELLALQKRSRSSGWRRQRPTKPCPSSSKNCLSHCAMTKSLSGPIVTSSRSERDAEVAVRDALNRDWMSHLLSLYGALGRDTLSRAN